MLGPLEVRRNIRAVQAAGAHKPTYAAFASSRMKANATTSNRLHDPKQSQWLRKTPGFGEHDSSVTSQAHILSVLATCLYFVNLVNNGQTRGELTPQDPNLAKTLRPLRCCKSSVSLCFGVCFLKRGKFHLPMRLCPCGFFAYDELLVPPPLVFCSADHLSFRLHTRC